MRPPLVFEIARPSIYRRRSWTWSARTVTNGIEFLYLNEKKIEKVTDDNKICQNMLYITYMAYFRMAVINKEVSDFWILLFCRGKGGFRF